MIRGAEICLEDLHGHRGLTNNQKSRNHWQKEICSSSTERKQQYFCCTYSSSSRANDYTNPLLLSGLNRLANEQKNRNFAKYSDFSNIFSSDSAAELPEHTRINNHLINLLGDKQLPYGPIYSLKPVELETFKTYIKANLVSSFIRPSKFPFGTLILFI